MPLELANELSAKQTDARVQRKEIVKETRKSQGNKSTSTTERGRDPRLQLLQCLRVSEFIFFLHSLCFFCFVYFFSIPGFYYKIRDSGKNARLPARFVTRVSFDNYWGFIKSTISPFYSFVLLNCWIITYNTHKFLLAHIEVNLKLKPAISIQIKAIYNF